MENFDIETLGACALGLEFGYEPNNAHQIVDALGSCGAVYSIPRRQLESITGPYSRIRDKISQDSLDRARRTLETVRSIGAGFLPLNDGHYPPVLKDCPDCPMGLYYRASSPPKDIFNGRQAVAIVGTRDISHYGSEWCRRIVEALSEAPDKPVIVSGLALGVDVTAHLEALDCGLPTIAVLPTGIDEVYPRVHSNIAERIASTPGCALVTDYPPGTSPQACTFLRRNRIIAGLAQNTLLIESKAKGGGMMTARLASSYGRSVFALPGRIDDIRSAGCNALIAEKTAEPIADLGTLPDALGLGHWNRRRKATLAEEAHSRYDGVMAPERVRRLADILQQIRVNRGICPDELCRIFGLDPPEVSLCIGLLESDGFIQTDLLQRCTINPKKL